MTQPSNTSLPSSADATARLAERVAAGEDLASMFNAINPGTLGERMGIEFVSVRPEQVVATMPVAGNTQPYGLLHGGASCVLAETIGSVAAALHAASQGSIAVGVDINATHHRAATSGLVTGTTTPLSLGSSLASFNVAIEDEKGRRICTARITCMLRSATPPSGHPNGATGG